jgi:hypothetical protein
MDTKHDKAVLMAFYQHCGCQLLIGQPRTLFLLLTVAEKLFLP